MTTLIIRPFQKNPADYKAVLAVRNAAHPTNPSSVAVWQHVDSIRPKDIVFHRVVMMRQDMIIAYGQYGQTAAKNGRFFLNSMIHPQFVRQGIATRLYNHMLAKLSPYNPTSIISQLREHETTKLNWHLEHGFVPTARYPISVLNLADFNPHPFVPMVNKINEMGIQVLSLTTLKTTDSNWQRKVYDLYHTLMADVPLSEPYEQRSFAHFIRQELEHPNFLIGGWWLAVMANSYVGMSALMKLGGQTTHLGTALTGVLPPYRRQGLATALKVHALQFAKTIKATTIETGNEENNPMYRLNQKLGFKPQPAWLEFVREMS